jgi:hypothetical protein
LANEVSQCGRHPASAPTGIQHSPIRLQLQQMSQSSHPGSAEKTVINGGKQVEVIHHLKTSIVGGSRAESLSHM